MGKAIAKLIENLKEDKTWAEQMSAEPLAQDLDTAIVALETFIRLTTTQGGD